MKKAREIERLKAKLASEKAPMLSWEAKRILKLFAQGLTDWQQPPYRKLWRQNYRQALKDYSAEFSSAEGPSSSTLYFLLFMIAFRGGKDSEKAKDSELEFWLLARQVAPKGVAELLSDSEDKRELLEAIDKVLAEPEEPTSEGGTSAAENNTTSTPAACS